jgi:nucleoid-associated protein YgaU
MRAVIEGVHYAKTHRKETMEVITKYLRTDDKEVLEDTYESIVLGLVPEKPYPTQKGIQIILREFGAKDPAARSARPDQFVDLTIVKELDGSGFIDRLYKSTVVPKVPPRTETVVVAASSKEKPTGQVAETRAKPAPSEEKPKPVTKPIPAASDKAPVTMQQQYTVKAGDTLSKLAEQFYNSMTKWEKIYEANRDQLKNPNYIFIGQKLIIPPDDKAS